MARKRSEKDLQRIHIWMEVEHVEWLKEMFEDSLGFSRAVQQIIGLFIRQQKARVQQEAQSVKLPPGLLDELNKVEG